MQEVKPISPDEITSKKLATIPPEVIEIVNNIIATKWTGSSARFKQEELVDMIVEKLNVSKDVIFDKHWLDFEDIYREKGWRVFYDKPAYNESYPATFEFSIKR